TSTLGCPRGCAMGDLLSDELVAHDCGGETDPGVLKEVHLGDRHGARGQCLPATKRELSGLIPAIDRCTALAVIQSQRGRLHESAAILDSIPPKRDTDPRIGVRRHHEDGIRRNRSSVHDRQRVHVRLRPAKDLLALSIRVALTKRVPQQRRRPLVTLNQSLPRVAVQERVRRRNRDTHTERRLRPGKHRLEVRLPSICISVFRANPSSTTRIWYGPSPQAIAEAARAKAVYASLSG